MIGRRMVEEEESTLPTLLEAFLKLDLGLCMIGPRYRVLITVHKVYFY